MIKHASLSLSVAEARGILGESYNNYSDEYIEQLIVRLDNIVIAFIESVPDSQVSML